MRVVALGATATLALTAAAACGSDEAEGDGKTITFVAAEYSDKTEPYWQDLVSRFEKANPGLKVDLQGISWDDIDGHVQNLVLNDKAPDLLNLNKFADFAEDGLLYKAGDVLPKEVLDDFIPSFAESSKFEGEQYGLPFIASARLLFYNKDLFAKAKISEPPKTWDELKEAAKKISDLPGDAIGYGLPLGPEEAQGEFQIWINSNGGHWVDDQGNWTIDSPENLETLQFLKSMVDEGLTQPNPAKTDRADVIEAFAAGLPVVATDVGGIRAAAGEAVELIPPGDAEAAAAAIGRVLDDDARRLRMVETGLALAREHTIEAETGRVAAFIGAA